MSGKRWVPFEKGGSVSRFYRDWELVIDWGYDGEVVKREVANYRGSRGWGYDWSADLKGHSFYFRPGLTWPRRADALSFRVLPAGCIFADKGPAIFVDGDKPDYLLALCALLNSQVFKLLVSLQLGRVALAQSYEVGLIQQTPMAIGGDSDVARLQEIALVCFVQGRSLDQIVETSHVFSSPALLQVGSNTLIERCVAHQNHTSGVKGVLSAHQNALDAIAFRTYGIKKEDRVAIESLTEGEKKTSDDEPETDADDNNEELEETTSAEPSGLVADLLSYCLGVIFGRWDARIGKDPSLGATLGGTFDQLPVCTPSMLTEDAALVGKDGPLPYRPERLSAAPEHVPADYPLPVQWLGIVVDDEGHPNDLVARVRSVLAYLFGPEQAPAIEAEAIALLQEGGVKVKSLGDYYATRFFGMHIKRYSKSRRKAPIYWQLASRRKSYSLWLYYHRLHPGTLYQALQEYVEPKIELERKRLLELEDQQRAATDSRAARNLAGQVDKKATLVEELIQFGNDLKEAADRGFAPDLNDGVILNIAPLHKLVSWPDAATAWKELQAGKYPWSTIGQRLMRTDKSSVQQVWREQL